MSTGSQKQELTAMIKNQVDQWGSFHFYQVDGHEPGEGVLHPAFPGDTVKGVHKVGGKYTAVELPVPSAVKDYNRFMGVDLSDQLIGSCSSWKKSRKGYVTLL